ncbi:ATP-binding protein [Pedobacter xixiisoli]|uniref:histidine kinase n=1 Tax=Pedobacter xixiisoli TaxID=1476464 RepID=A0A286A024_9SPHI|nr:ATP-binding protein [Pedobacter xixiisoli]SOD15254.1 Signal transduction histidine kinase [Pedobacter xixiisoli]
MTINNKKSSARFGLIVILILALFISAIFFYTRSNRINVLSTNVDQLDVLENDYAKLDTCILVLYRADNNSRLFEATGNNVYIRQFSKEIEKVSGILEGLNIKDNTKNQSQNIKGLVEQKRAKMQLYLKLKQLTDSLMYVSSGIDTVKERTWTKGLEITRGKFKTMLTIDTIKPKQEREEKGLIGRIADAFKQKKKIDTSATIVRKEITLDTSLTSRNYNKMQLRNINTYFRNLYNTRKILKNNEIEVLRINSKIVNEIVALIQDFKAKETSFVAQTKRTIHYDLDNTFKSINKIYLFIFCLLALLVAAILFNLWKIYRNENNLIDYGQKAALYAQSKSRFLANMSHEIRTPLNSVIGFSEQLSQNELSEQQKEQINAIKTSSELLLDLVNDILDFSKYEVGKINFDKVSFAPADAINEVFNSIAILASRKGLKLEKQVSFDSKTSLRGDSLRLKQVIMNLLSNAIKFTDKGSVILKADIITNAKKKGILKIQVIDTGAGIEDKDALVIFDEFSQANYAATKNTQKGTGLGLAICKKIVELQGGKIGLTSKLNKGSNFTFEIPYEFCFDVTNKQKKLVIADISHLAGKRILLVDDNKLNILLAQTVVKKYKMLTDVANDGAEAYQLFEKNNYDLILTDVQMPVMGGVELTRLIRAEANANKASVPILGVTANVMEEDRERYLDSGMNALVLKPYSEKELIDKIAAHISS